MSGTILCFGGALVNKESKNPTVMKHILVEGDRLKTKNILIILCSILEGVMYYGKNRAE